jgi:hypothetical protein
MYQELKKNNKVLLVEINKIRKMMNLNLLVETNVFSQGINFWKKLLNATSKADLTSDEIGITQKLIDNSSTIRSYGPNSVDILLSKSGKEVLKTILEKETKNELATLLKVSIDQYYQNSIKKLTQDLDKTVVSKINSILKSQPITNGSVFDIIRRIENDGFTYIPENILDTTIVQLDGLKNEVGDYAKMYLSSVSDNMKSVLNSRGRNFVKDAEEAVSNTTNLISGKIDDATKYLRNLDPQQLIDRLPKRIGPGGWRYFGAETSYPMSGWKFHIFGVDLADSVFLYEKLEPIVSKYGAMGKVGGIDQVGGYVMIGKQYGKQGATIYIPPSVINSNKHKDMLMEIQSVLDGYTRGGNISGDNPINNTIHYRYEFDRPVPKEGVSEEIYRQIYNKNTGGPYKPDNVIDIFTGNY